MIFETTDIYLMDQEMISLFQPQSTSSDISSNGKFIEVVAKKGFSHKLMELKQRLKLSIRKATALNLRWTPDRKLFRDRKL